MVREIKSSPLLLGYRGSEVVDLEAVERLILGVSQLQYDLPQVRSLELSLVLAGAAGRERADLGDPGGAGHRPALGLVRPSPEHGPGGHPSRLTVHGRRIHGR